MSDQWNDEGQMTIDFLFGLTVFLFALVYLVMMVPGLFLPYQNNAVDLSSVVYRTSTLLVEDPGYFKTQSGAHGTQWEAMADVSDIQRVGLASSRSTPEILSKDKLAALKNLPYEASRDKLGLSNTVKYDYYLTITWINNSSPPRVVSTDVINGITPNSQNVETIQRSVLIDEGKRLLVDGSRQEDNTQLAVNVSRANIVNGNARNNITLTILNTPAGDNAPGCIYQPTINFSFMPPYGYDTYVIYINNSTTPAPPPGSPPLQIPQGSRVDIVMNGSTLADTFLLNDNDIATVTFNTNMYIFNDTLVVPARPYDDTNPLYCSIYDKAILNLRVWS